MNITLLALEHLLHLVMCGINGNICRYIMGSVETHFRASAAAAIQRDHQEVCAAAPTNAARGVGGGGGGGQTW